MKAKVVDSKGNTKGTITLPEQFSEEYRPIVIMRAFNSNMSYNYVHHGTDPLAGMRHVTELSKRRRKYRGVYGHGWTRTPKKVMMRRGTQFSFVADKAPHTRKGRVAHPPLVEKVFEEKINKKERLLAIRSAISATVNKELVLNRNHAVEKVDIPIVVDGAESISKAKDVEKLLLNIGLKEELERASVKKVRAGKGKMRGRRYKTRKGPLFVVSGDCPLMKASSSLPGVESIDVKNLNVTLLAPGGVAGRLTIWTKESIELMAKEKLFMGGNK